MLLVTAAAFFLFWLRDYWLLQLGPARRVGCRVWIYVGTIALVGVGVWAVTAPRNAPQFISRTESFPLLTVLFAFHILSAAACFWLKRTERYHLVWFAAMIPAPAAWVLLAKVVSKQSADDPSRAGIVGGVAVVWVLAMLLAVLRAHGGQMAVGDLDYVTGFAGWLNCFGAGLVVVAISPDAVESFAVAIRALAWR